VYLCLDQYDQLIFFKKNDQSSCFDELITPRLFAVAVLPVATVLRSAGMQSLPGSVISFSPTSGAAAAD
jgi:hypothetical protein